MQEMFQTGDDLILATPLMLHFTCARGIDAVVVVVVSTKTLQ